MRPLRDPLLYKAHSKVETLQLLQQNQFQILSDCPILSLLHVLFKYSEFTGL